MEQDQKKTLTDSKTASNSSRRLLAFKNWVVHSYREHVYRYYDLHERDYRLAIWTTFGTTFIVLAMVAALVVRTQNLKHEQQDLVLQARMFLASGDYARAMANASKALALNPTDLNACRIMADAASLSHSTAELIWVQRLTDIAPSTENKLRLAEVGLRCQAPPYPLTTSILEELSAAAANNSRFHALAGNLAKSLHQADGAAAQFESALRLDPTNQEYALQLAIVQLGSANPAKNDQARQQLAKLGANPDLGGAALRALVADRISAGDNVAAQHYSEQLVAASQAALTDRLQNLEILRSVNPALFADRLHSVQALAAADAPDVAQVSAWMLANGLAIDNLEWLQSLPKNIRTTEIFKVSLAKAYTQNGKWQEVLDLGNGENWGDLDSLRLAFVSHAWSQLGLPTLAQSNWGEAVKKASDHYSAMTNLLALAQSWQLTDVQQDLRQRILQLSPQ